MRVRESGSEGLVVDVAAGATLKVFGGSRALALCSPVLTSSVPHKKTKYKKRHPSHSPKRDSNSSLHKDHNLPIKETEKYK